MDGNTTMKEFLGQVASAMIENHTTALEFETTLGDGTVVTFEIIGRSVKRPRQMEVG